MIVMLFWRRYVRKSARPHYFFIAAVLLITIIVYIYRMTLFFPGSEPIGYSAHNLMGSIFPNYNAVIEKALLYFRNTILAKE